MRFETPGEDRYRDAYRALRELQVALQAIAHDDGPRSAAHRTDLERVAGHHLGTIERLIESEHHAFLQTTPGRMVLTDEEARTLPGLRSCPEGGICHKGCQGDHCWREAPAAAAATPPELPWQAWMRRLTEAMIDPIRLEPPPLPPADMPPIDLDGYAAERLAALLYEAADPEHPADPTGIDSHERYENPGDQA